MYFQKKTTTNNVVNNVNIAGRNEINNVKRQSVVKQGHHPGTTEFFKE